MLEFSVLLLDKAGRAVDVRVICAAHLAEAQAQGLQTAAIRPEALEFQVWRGGKRLRKLPIGPHLLSAPRWEKVDLCLPRPFTRRDEHI